MSKAVENVQSAPFVQVHVSINGYEVAIYEAMKVGDLWYEDLNVTHDGAEDRVGSILQSASEAVNRRLNLRSWNWDAIVDFTRDGDEPPF